MTKRRKVDASKVIEAVESGRLSKDVLNSYGLEKTGNEAEGTRTRRRRRKKVEIEEHIIVTISKRGSLAIPKTFMEELGFKEDDAFTVRKTRAGFILKPVSE